jgi:hypothetical protein
MGAWFLTVAAGLEYMYGKEELPASFKHDSDDAAAGEDHDNGLEAQEEQDARIREEAGAEWLVEQGFDRKD